MARPFRVPLSTLGCAIALIPTIAALVLVIVLASYTTICVNAIMIPLGMLVHSATKRNSVPEEDYGSADVDKETVVC